MTVHRKTWISALLVFGVVATFSVGATGHDPGADLIKIATRFVENYTSVRHKAGDADGAFIEDVVIPSVVNVADGYKGEVPAGTRSELYRFLLAGKSMASEELSALAARLYLSSPTRFCRDVSTLATTDRHFLIKQASDGLALRGTKFAKMKCA